VCGGCRFSDGHGLSPSNHFEAPDYWWHTADVPARYGIGHISLLERAREEGDRLVVAINSDSFVRGVKVPSRPIVGEQDRGRILSALAAVDAVVVFDDPTPLGLIEALRPDVIVKAAIIEKTPL
jgi:rfaE bifunctional protein nucleotidyltransferase chain/domain